MKKLEWTLSRLRKVMEMNIRLLNSRIIKFDISFRVNPSSVTFLKNKLVTQ